MTYKDIIQKMVHGSRYKTTEKVLEECNISINSYYKVTNKNCKQPNGTPYNTPMEWITPLTKSTNNFSLIEQICRDVDGMFIPPDKLKILRERGEEVVSLLEDFLKILK